MEVDGGTVRKARRVVRGSDRNWDITVMPDGDRDLAIALPAQRACDSHGAVCTSAEGRLHNGPHAVVTLRPTQVPPPPTNLRAKALNDGTVVLTWDAHDDDSITGYLVGRRRHHQSEWGHSTMEIVTETRSTATTVTQQLAAHDVLHAFYVKAVNAAGASERSNYDNATPFVGEFWEVGFHLPIVYLTFDDGPNPRFTPQILDLLAEYGARATFFVNGTRAALNPELIARITAEGHSVGNHAWQHESLPGLVRENFNSTLTRAQDLVGERGVRCLRPPYGHIDPVTRGWASSLGLKVVRWNVDSEDSEGAKAAKMVSKLSANVGYFDVVLMHDTNERTVEAVRIMLGRWAQQGYEFKPVCEPSATATRPLNAVATGPPSVSGLAQVGQSLVADASAVTDGDGLEGVEFSYQWLADDAEIAGAVHTSYTATADQEGRSITVQVSFVDNEGNQE